MGRGRGRRRGISKREWKGREGRLRYSLFRDTGTPDSGRGIGEYLNGGFGELERVTPYFPALLYAGDRFESLELITRAIKEKDLLILDRYTASNLAYQGARQTEEERGPFLSWLVGIEHEVYGLPRPDLNIFFSVATDVSMSLVSRKGEREYTDKERDIHEENEDYLRRCLEVYDYLIDRHLPSRWMRIECLSEDGRMREEEAIAEEVWEAVQSSEFRVQSERVSSEQWTVSGFLLLLIRRLLIRCIWSFLADSTKFFRIPLQTELGAGDGTIGKPQGRKGFVKS